MSVLSDMRNGAYQALGNTSGLAQRYSARPATVGSTPAGWVDETRADLIHDSGTRQWSGEQDVWLVVSGFDNEEEQTALDALAVSLIDYCSDNPHLFGANTVVEPVRVRVSSAEFGEGVTLPAAVVTLGRFVFQEGR